jgi:two-component system OmpR family response regulator
MEPTRPNAPHILVVDDDLEIRKLLGRYLTEQEFRVTLASDRRTLKEALAVNRVSLIVLDVLLPDGSGLDICRELRIAGSRIPIILLTALKEDVDRILGLEIGADDYLGKPFNPRELLARIRAVLRGRTMAEQAAPPKREYLFGQFKVNSGLREVIDERGYPVDLTGAEFDLLLVLLARAGTLLSREQLLSLTSRGPEEAFDRSVDVLMSRLRKKLGDNENFSIIKTIRKGGYIFTARVETVGEGE